MLSSITTLRYIVKGENIIIRIFSRPLLCTFKEEYNSSRIIIYDPNELHVVYMFLKYRCCVFAPLSRNTKSYLLQGFIECRKIPSTYMIKYYSPKNVYSPLDGADMIFLCSILIHDVLSRLFIHLTAGNAVHFNINAHVYH